jgi:LysM repeat protein
MKKISLIALGFFIVFNLYAEEKMENIDKLDVLDKQSKEFFNAITGLEKNYLEEQVNAIKNKKDETILNPNQNINGVPTTQIIKEEIKLSQEDYEKNVFTHQNDMARLTTDFTRTKKLKDLKIKSMYSFNGKDYVVLELIDEATKTTKLSELSANIEGRYIEGDNILGHKIMDINTRTKSVSLYKKLDEEYGYTIYLSNYGISVSDLEKIPKVETQDKEKDKEKAKKAKSELKEEAKNAYKEEFPIKKAFEQVKTDTKLTKEQSSDCLYTVKKANLNVRNTSDSDAKVLRILKVNDQFTIKQKNSDWAQIGTIYKKISGDVMDVSGQNNWVQILEETVTNSNKNCM